MANNNLEKYLEAILDKIADGTETDVPRPSWNIEKYLAAIYEAESNVDPVMTPKVVHHDREIEVLLTIPAVGEGTFVTATSEKLGPVTSWYYHWSQNGFAPPNDAEFALVSGDDRDYDVEGLRVAIGGSSLTGTWGYQRIEDLAGKTISFCRVVADAYDEEVYPPNVLNLYDPSDPHGDESFLPEYATKDGETVVIDSTFDKSDIFKRLSRGQNVWIRYDGYVAIVQYVYTAASGEIYAIECGAGYIEFESDNNGE